MLRASGLGPAGRDLMAAVPDVENVHHVHAWMLTDERPLMTLHAAVDPGTNHHAALLAIQEFLEQRYGVGHATIQIEPKVCGEGGCLDGMPAD